MPLSEILHLARKHLGGKTQREWSCRAKTPHGNAKVNRNLE